MKNLPVERSKYRLWFQLLKCYIFWILAKKSISIVVKTEAEWNLLIARCAYRSYKIIEPLEEFIH